MGVAKANSTKDSVEGRYADAVDELLIKFINAKKKKFKIKITEGTGNDKDNF